MVNYEYRSGDAARNSMFIVGETGVFWVCKQWHICIIRLIRDARVEIPWIGVGAVGKAASMLVREVSVGADMVDNRFRLEQNALTCRVDLRLLRGVKRPQQEIQLISVF